LLDGVRYLLDSDRSCFERISVNLTGTPQPGRTLDRDAIAVTNSAGDIRRLVSIGSNLLVRGEKSATAATVVALSADLSAPLVTWTAGTDTPLPQVDRGTIILQDVDRLDVDAQRTLLDWLDESRGRVRVISTARSDLFDLVIAGAFLDSLYYRLNTIVVDVAARTGACSLQ
jgi:hypothetical protein